METLSKPCSVVHLSPATAMLANRSLLATTPGKEFGPDARQPTIRYRLREPTPEHLAACGHLQSNSCPQSEAEDDGRLQEIDRVQRGRPGTRRGPSHASPGCRLPHNLHAQIHRWDQRSNS